MAMASQIARLGLVRIRIPKASDILADQIKDNIISGGFPHGVQLPSEKDLVEQLGLSRPTVRDALRMLENEGLIVVKPGRSGGAIVRHPSSESLSKPLALLLEFQKTRLSDLLEARRMVEPLIAQLAAVNRNDEGLAAIEESLDLMGSNLDDDQVFLAANVSFHVAVASASGNAVLETLLSSLRDLIYQFTSELNIDAGTRGLTLEEHTIIFEAIRDHDGALAAQRMLDHHLSFDAYMGNKYGDVTSIMITAKPRQSFLMRRDSKF